MDKLSTKLKLVRSQSMGVGMGSAGIEKSHRLRPPSQFDSTSTTSSTSSNAPMGPPTQGRNASIVLLDERRLEMMIQPRLFAGELLDLVASHCGLKEKEYFGLAIVDENGLYTWLTLDRKVLDHELPRKPSNLTIHFLVKFFIESISHLMENKTVELFYLQARSLIFRGTLEVESDIVFQLAALGLQASHGDFIDDITSRNLIKKIPILPSSVLKEHPSSYCEEQVIEHYMKTKGQTRGQALVNYMTIVESMPTYGVHYFEVFDKRQSPWWLGLSCKGIAQYSHNDRKVPVRVFQWKQLENLYFRDKKFSIEVHDAKRVIQTVSSFNLYEDALKLDGSSIKTTKDSDLMDAINDSTTQVSTSRRSFNPGAIHVYVWFGKTQGLTKCIWQSAISQHQFYLDRKQARLRHHIPPRSLKEIARVLTRSSVSLSSASSLSNLSRHSSTSTHSLAGAAGAASGAASANVSLGGATGVNDQEVSEETRRARMEMLAALKARRDALDAKLKEKNKLLKELCIKEGELTGELPPEIPLAPGESVPVIRRRVGTEFALSSDMLKRINPSSPEEELLVQLELEREIQSQITSAALKISNDPSASKSVRKQRKISYQQSQRKLKEIESKLSSLKLHINNEKSGKRNNKKSNRLTSSSSLEGTTIRRGVSVPDLEMTESEDDDDNNDKETTDQVDSSTTNRGPRSCPASPRKHPPNSKFDSASLEAGNSPSRMPRVVTGYIPSSVYLRSSYRTKQYPTLTNDQGIKHHHMIVPTPDMVLGRGTTPSLLMASSSASSATLPSSSSPYRNKYELNLQCDSPVGLYNIPQQRTSQAFSSLDDIDAMVVQQQLNSSPVTRLEAAAGNYPSLERSARKKFRNEQQQQQQNHHTLHHHAQRELPALPKTNGPLPPRSNSGDRNRSMEDLHKLEATHGRQKMQYREITDNNSNTWSGGGPYPLPPSVNRTTLLPGQTYPEPQPANGPLNLGMVASIQDVLFNTSKLSSSSSNSDNNNKKDFTNNGTDPPPLYPKQYHQVVEQRRRSLLNNHNESPAVNRKVKPLLATPPLGVVSALTSPIHNTSIATASPPLPPPSSTLDSSFDNPMTTSNTTTTTTSSMINGDGLKFVPYRETTKPFEMSDFYKYSTKYRKSASSLKSGESESSDRSSTTSSGGSSQPPPEVPARSAAPPPPLIPSGAVISSPHPPSIPSTSSPAKLCPPPPPPKHSLNTHSSNTSLADAFSSEMLAWYNTQNTPVKSSSSSSSAAASSNSNSSKTTSSTTAATKPATLV